MSTLMQQLLRGRFFDHPIHVALVHYPLALLQFSFVLDLISAVKGDGTLETASFYALIGGVGIGVIAAIFGAMDYFRIPAEHRAWNEASLHALLNVTWICVYAVLLGIRWKLYPDFPPPGLW